MKLVRAIHGWVDRNDKWLAGALLLIATAHFVVYAQRRFSFDEIFTFYFSQLQGIDSLLKAIPADGNPPLYYLLAHVSQSLTGLTEFGTRLPSIVAYLVGAIGTYLFVRRRCSGLPALFSLFILIGTEPTAYATYARPYALLLAFTVMTLVSWQVAAERTSHRLLPLTGVSLGIAGALASHHFGVLHVGIPLALGEAWRLYTRRKLDIPMYVAGALGASMLLLTLPMIQQTNLALLEHVRASPIFYGRPVLSSLGAYRTTADRWVAAAFLVLIVLLWFFYPSDRTATATRKIPGHEVAAAAGLALLIPILVVLSLFTTNYFLSRYAVGALVGVAILAGYVASAPTKLLRGGGTAALVCMSLFVSYSVLQDLRNVVAVARGRYYTPPPDPSSLAAATPGQPIVAGSMLTYLPLWFYSSPELRARLRYLADVSFAVSYTDPLGELTLVASQPFVPMKSDDYRTFVAAHREFFLYCDTDKEIGDCGDRTGWVARQLVADGYTLTAVSRAKQDVLFLAKRQ